MIDPLERRVRELEDSIKQAELEFHNDTQALVKASTDGDSGKISELAKKTHGAKENIEALYEQLDRASGEYEGKLQDYAKRMEEIEKDPAAGVN